MRPGLAIAVSVPHAVSLVAFVALKVVSRALAGSNLDVPSVVKVGQLRATVTRAHRHHPLAPDAFSAFQSLAEAHQMVARVAEDLAEQEALLFGAVYQNPTIGNLRNGA